MKASAFVIGANAQKLFGFAFSPRCLAQGCTQSPPSRRGALNVGCTSAVKFSKTHVFSMPPSGRGDKRAPLCFGAGGERE